MRFRRREIEYKELPDNPPDPCGWPKRRVEDYAEKLVGTVGFELGSSLSNVVEALGGTIHYLDLEEWESESGSIFVHGEWDFDLVLSEYTSPTRDQFTIGHELGHYFLHSQQGEIPLVACRDNSNTRLEWEANWFSAALLMPADKFTEHWNKHRQLGKSAAHFGVSTQAADVRRKSLGLDE